MDVTFSETSQTYPIKEQSQVGEIRRHARALAAQLGFQESDRERVAIIATETANNIVRHAGQGQIVMRSMVDKEIPGIEIVVLDRGAGMGDISKCLEDGYSTAGTAGTGLGAVKRLSNRFSVFSLREMGTALLSEVWAKAPSRAEPSVTSAVSLPYPGETACGDRWAVESGPERSVFLVVDGLGHGRLAAEAAEAAVNVFHHCADRSPSEIIQRAHHAMRKTRGAVMAIAEINTVKQQVCFAGVGNIAGRIIGPDSSQSLVSHNGTVGQEIRKTQEFFYSWSRDSLLVMHSDGLTMHWDLSRYPGLSCQPASLIAGVLYRDFSRGKDDATVLVHRGEASHSLW